MSIAYVDTSALVAIAFDEPCGEATGERLDGYSRLLSSNLLEAAQLYRGGCDTIWSPQVRMQLKSLEVLNWELL